MVDCQLEEEEEEEMTLRRRCLSLTQLETRSVSLGSSLPSSPLRTPLKSRLLGTPTKSSSKGTPKKMTAAPVRRPVLTPVRSNPTLLTPVRNQKQDKPSWEEEVGLDQEGKGDEGDLGDDEAEVAELQEGGSLEHLEDQNLVAHSAQPSSHGEEALDLRVGFGAKENSSDGVLEPLQHQPLLLDEREPVVSSLASTQSQWEMCSSLDSPRKALLVAGDPQSPITTSFGWVEGNLEGGSQLVREELRVGSDLEGEGSLIVTEGEVLVVEQISR